MRYGYIYIIHICIFPMGKVLNISGEYRRNALEAVVISEAYLWIKNVGWDQLIWHVSPSSSETVSHIMERADSLLILTSEREVQGNMSRVLLFSHPHTPEWIKQIKPIIQPKVAKTIVSEMSWYLQSYQSLPTAQSPSSSCLWQWSQWNGCWLSLVSL